MRGSRTWGQCCKRTQSVVTNLSRYPKNLSTLPADRLKSFVVLTEMTAAVGFM